MKDEIINNLGQPKELEKLYRNNKSLFKKTFDTLYPEISNNHTAQIWNERLHFESGELSWGAKNELPLVIVLSLIACVIAKLPEFFGWNAEHFFTRNLGFVAFPALAAYFAWKQNLSPKKIMVIAGTVLVSVIYINILPGKELSDTLIIACVHLPLFMWMVMGFAFTGNEVNNFKKRIDFLRYNGDLVVITTVILIAGGLLTGVTIGLFGLIDLNIGELYFNNIVICGLAACTIVGTYLVQSNPQLVKNVSPVIAKVFTPLVLITLVVYLLAIVNTGKSPFTDREYLMVFNMLLIGVMAIVLFSVSETSKNGNNKFGTIMLLALCIVTIVVNTIALSAIIFRIAEWGITPNRLVVSGANILILINLLLVTYKLFKSTRNSQEIENVEKIIASFLPVYLGWIMLVIFLLPLMFDFK